MFRIKCELIKFWLVQIFLSSCAYTAHTTKNMRVTQACVCIQIEVNTTDCLKQKNSACICVYLLFLLICKSITIQSLISNKQQPEYVLCFIKTTLRAITVHSKWGWKPPHPRQTTLPPNLICWEQQESAQQYALK